MGTWWGTHGECLGLNDKGKKTSVPFLVDGYEPETYTCINFMGVIGMAIHAQKIVQKDNKRDIKTRFRLIGL